MCLVQEDPKDSRSNVQKEIASSYWIGIGRIMLENKNVYPHEYILEVSTTYKGDNKEFIKLVSGIGGGDCGFVFDYDKEYLIYAGHYSFEVLKVTNCSRTRLLEESGDVDLLNLYLKGVAYPTQLSRFENQFLRSKTKVEKSISQSLNLFYYQNKLVSKMDFFNLPSYHHYQFIEFTAMEQKKVKPKTSKERMNHGAVVANSFYKKFKRKKLIRQLRRIKS